jgi:hypothetical protein
MLLRHYLAQGESESALARQLGISRDTVHRWIRDGDLGRDLEADVVRYEHASTVLASNKGFEDWGDIFGNDVMAAALIDRLVHHCHLVTTRGNVHLQTGR